MHARGPYVVIGEAWEAIHLIPVRAALMRHRVEHVVDADANSQGGIPFRVIRIVSPLPGIADVGLKRQGHHHASMIVVDAAPMVRTALALKADAPHYGTVAGHLVMIVEIVDGVKNRLLDRKSTRLNSSHLGISY